jgi:hypothetical protein
MYIIENRDTFLKEVANSPNTVKSYLKDQFLILITDKRIGEYIEAVINDRSEDTIKSVKKIMQEISHL